MRDLRWQSRSPVLNAPGQGLACRVPSKMTCALEADEAGVIQNMANAITASARFTIRTPLDHYAQVSGVKIRRATASPVAAAGLGLVHLGGEDWATAGL